MPRQPPKPNSPRRANTQVASSLGGRRTRPLCFHRTSQPSQGGPSSKFLSSWIQNNLYLALADAPFDRGDATLNPVAGACTTCPRRSGYNTALFSDVLSDECLDGNCFRSKISAHVDREIAAHPEFVQIETSWRNRNEQRPGVVASTKSLTPPRTPTPSRPALHPHRPDRLRQARWNHRQRLHRGRLPHPQPHRSCASARLKPADPAIERSSRTYSGGDRRGK